MATFFTYFGVVAAAYLVVFHLLPILEGQK